MSVPSLGSRARVIAFLALVGLYPEWGVWAQPPGAKKAAEEGDYQRARQLLESHLTNHPDDARARFLYARVLAWSGRYAEAREAYDQLLMEQPRNVDYLLGLAQAWYWDQRPRKALTLLRRARKAEPSYRSVYQLELDILATLHRPAAQRRYRRVAALARKRLSDWQDIPSHPAHRRYPRTELEAGMRYEQVDSGLAPWRAQYLRLDRYLKEGLSLNAEVRQTDRFGNRERQGRLGMYFPLTEQWTGRAEVRASPDPTVLARWGATAGLQRALESGWVVSGALDLRAYSDALSGIATLTVARYVGPFRLSYSGRPTWLEGAGASLGHGVGGFFYYGSANRVGLTGSFSRELGYDASGQPISSQVRGLALSGRHWLTSRWGVSYRLGRLRQEPFYARTGGSLGIRYRF